MDNNKTHKEDNMHTEITTYTDYKDRPTALTEEELAWFHQAVDQAKKATGCPVDIVAWDHEQCPNEAQNALGLTWTEDPKNTLGDGVDTYITIDCYFIDECWRHEFQGDYLIAGENLLHVIAHEIAHLSVWRHGKKHTALTEQLYQRIIAA